MRLRLPITRERLVPTRLQARRALLKERVLVAEVGPWKLRYHSSSVIGQAIAEGRGWEATLGEAIDRLLPRDEPLLIADIGSNIGTSLAQMILVRPDARYVCFEPADRFRDLLVQNISENGWENVVVEDYLVGAESGKASLFTNTSTSSVARRDYGGHVFLHASTRRVERLDDYFHDAERLDMIKTDTDGFDFDVLLGAAAVLSRLAPVLYFEFAPFLAQDVGRKADEFLGFLQRLAYAEYLVLAQAGHALALTSDPSAVIALADEHKYVDVLTAARPDQVAALPEVAAATTVGELAPE